MLVETSTVTGHFYKALDWSKNKIKSIVYSLYSVPPTGNILALDIQCFTPSQRSKTQRRYILSPEIQNYNALVDRWWWGNFLQCTGHHIWCTGIDSSHHIYAPPQEYQCTSARGILQAPVLVYFTSARAQQYSGILLSAALS